MTTTLTRLTLALAALASGAAAQDLPARWDELTASDWPQAMERSAATCILPIGILEKHGPHAPIGSDLIHVREWSARATKKEYAVVFPDYFYGQIYEARHSARSICLILCGLCGPSAASALKSPLFFVKVRLTPRFEPTIIPSRGRRTPSAAPARTDRP